MENNFCVNFQDRAWGDHWDEAVGEKMDLNPHIPKPEPPKEEEKKPAEEEKKPAEDNKKEEEKEKVKPPLTDNVFNQ